MPVVHDLTQPILLAILGLAAHDPRASHGGQALAIQGEPHGIAASSTFYSFTPTVSHTSGRSLEFRIQNKPPWASFGRRHGTLYGEPRPGNVGMYSDIIITVSDGETTVQLPPFAIRVVAPSAPPTIRAAG